MQENLNEKVAPATQYLLHGFINPACLVVCVIQKHLWVTERRMLDPEAYCCKLSPWGYTGQMTLQSSRLVLIMGNCAFGGRVNDAWYPQFLGKEE